MGYNVEVTEKADRDLAGLPRKILRNADRRISALSTDPRPPGSQKLSSSSDEYRIRVGAYRILYIVDDSTRTVTIARVLHRSVAYRR